MGKATALATTVARTATATITLTIALIIIVRTTEIKEKRSLWPFLSF